MVRKVRNLYIDKNSIESMHNKIKKQPWLQQVYDYMVKYCDESLLLLQSNYLEENKNGTTARKIGGKIGTLYSTYLFTKEMKYLDKAIQLYEIAIGKEFSYYYEINGHLAIGDVTLSLSVLYDFLYEYLTKEQRENAEKMITILASWLHEEDCTWGLPHAMVSSCNHNSVHYGALGVAGILLEKEEWITHGKERIALYLKHAMDDTGYLTEGVGYENYGLHTAILFCEAYKKRTNVQLLDLPVTMNEFIAHLLPNVGELLKLNDAGNGGTMMPQVYLNSRYKNGAGLYLLNAYETAKGDYFTTRSIDMSSSFVYPFIYLFADEDLELVSPTAAKLPLTNIFSSGRIMTRSAWDNPMAYYLAITCGVNYHNGHNHADQGSFSIHALGEDFLIDVGNATVEGRGHNIMMINGVDQLFGCSEGEMLNVKDTEESLKVVCDTIKSYNYNRNALLGISRRNFFYIKGEVPFLIIRDDMQTERTIEEKNLFEFMMHTALGNEIIAKDNYVEIIGANYKNKCKLNFVYPDDVVVVLSEEVREQYSYGKSTCGTDMFQEAIASCNHYNPFMTTIITFAKDGEDYPNITVSGDVHDLTITVEQNGKQKSVHVERYDICSVED